jgi:adenylosuccinate synthase
VGAGKSTLGDELVRRFGFVRLKTRDLLVETLEEAGRQVDRTSLQAMGDQLDGETSGEWVAGAIERHPDVQTDDARVLVDAVRIPEQIDAIRRAYGSRVVHVHLTASVSCLAERYSQRGGPAELASYEAVRANATEASVGRLEAMADIAIDTERNTKEDVLVRVAARLGCYGRGVSRLVDVVVGGQYGSEGKGNIAAFLAREYDVLVRVGGPNAGHKVFARPEPLNFHHLPSGTAAAPNARIVIGPGAVLNPTTLLEEIAQFGVERERLAIDPSAMVIEQADREFEARTLKGSIGSTGQGVGAATARKILRNAMQPPVRRAGDVAELRPYLHDSREVLDDAYASGRRVLLEGTQGTGLSLHHGAYPFVTSRDTTVSGCLSEAGIAPSRVRRIVMVCRTYPIRVQNPDGGTSGPMGLELTWGTVAQRSSVPLEEILQTEVTSTTKRDRRAAEFGWDLLRRAASLNGPTDIAMTFADYIDVRNKDARRFDQLTPATIQIIEEIERVAGAPVSLIATRFHFRNIIDRRAW